MSAKPERAELAAPQPTDAVAIDLAAELLRRGRPIELVVGGGSMWPLVRAGDRVRVEPAVGAQVGDLAAVLRAGHLVIHRVVRVQRDAFLLRGDNVGHDDALVPRSELIGVVSTQWRSGRVINHRAAWTAALNRLVAVTARSSRLPWRAARLLARLRRRVLGAESD